MGRLKRFKDIPKDLDEIKALLLRQGRDEGVPSVQPVVSSSLAQFLRSSSSLAPYAQYLSLPVRDADLSDVQRVVGVEAWLASLLGRWEVLEQLWEMMAARCSEGRVSCSAVEVELLERAVRLHNVLFVVNGTDRRVGLASVAVGDRFDPYLHRAVDLGFDVVDKVLLPGLVGFGGDLVRKSVVLTRR